MLIGDCLPRVEIYNDIFLSSSTVQAHVHGIYVTILDFWARAIKFYKRRKLWKFVRSSWHDYDVEFGNLETTLHRHQEGLEKAALAQHMSHYHADRDENKEAFKGIHFFLSLHKASGLRLPGSNSQTPKRVKV